MAGDVEHSITASGSPPQPKQRRPRPNTYAAKACERCRTRKQRCLFNTDDDESCRNCTDSSSVCVVVPRPERSKRARYERNESEQSVDDPSSRPSSSAGPTVPNSSALSSHDGPSATAQLDPQPAVNVELPSWEAAPAFAPAPLHPPLPPPRASDPIPQPSPVQYDWNAILTGFAQQAAKAGPDLPPLPAIPHLPQSLPPLPPPPPPHQPPHAFPAPPPQSNMPDIADPPDVFPSLSPTSESDNHSTFETAKGLAMVSLEATAEPHYVGESSGFLWTTVISKGMRPPKPAQTPKSPRQSSRSSSPSRLSVLRSRLLTPLSEELAQVLLDTTYKHLHSRYPFMDWLAFEKQWQARDEILLGVARNRISDKSESVAAYFLLMVLAIGAQYCRSQNVSGLLDAYDYYLLAQPYLRWIVQLHNLANVQGLLLLAIFSLRDTRGPSIWYISGVTMRLCIGLGLHRGRTPHNVSPYIAEMRKRIFWTCYTMDRMVSLLLGRPPGISDDDIDADLPLVESAPGETRTMASAVHYIKLKQLESRIQRSVFTISRRQTVTVSEIYPFLQAINDWEGAIPVESALEEHGSVPCCTRDWFLLRGVEAKIHLLRPLCQEKGDMVQAFCAQLAQIAAKGCELQKRTHLLGAPSSNFQLHSTFTCGLALLYSIFLQPTVLPLKDVFAAIKAASNTLFAYSSYTPTARLLFDVFEELSAVCIDRIGRVGPSAVGEASREWQKASSDAASNIVSESVVEYADLFRSLGIEMDNEPAATNDGMWDLSAFFPSPGGA